MISVNSGIKDIFNNNTTVNLDSGCTFEYNMNALVDNISVTSPNAYITKTDADGNTYQPFKKLFPLDTIVKPVRPNGAGVKYGIMGDIATNTYRSANSTEYPLNYRTYYAGIDTAYKYWVTIKGQGADITITYPKTIITNKIVAKFELAHSTPPSWTIYGNGSQLATGTSVVPFETSGNRNYDAGTVTIYYTGSAWTTDASLHNTSANVSLTSIRLTTGSVTDKYIGVIEFSPRWVVDVTNRLVKFDISKESSTGAEDLMPVGNVTANSLSLDLVSYESTRTVMSFDKTYTLDNSKIYIYKKIKINPYFKVYSTSGTLSDSRGLYTKISQGTFYVDNWQISEYGDVAITALDSAKILQDTLAPMILCENYSTTAILRRLLDTVGFTTYNFNIKKESGTITDKSLFTPKFWWADDSKTVWDAIKELCRDSQMVACFDENDVLQFYSRDYMFASTRGIDWTFTYDQDGSTLPSISSFSKRDLASANKVVVRWNNIVTSEYTSNAQPLYKSGSTYMGAFSIEQDLLASQVPVIDSNGNYTTKQYMKLAPITISEYSRDLGFFVFSGYVVINSEIIEYDAIEYEYVDTNNVVHQYDATSTADVLKYQALAKAGSQYNYITSRYRIKSRGAFGTTIQNHYVNAQNVLDGWSGYEVTWA